MEMRNFLTTDHCRRISYTVAKKYGLPRDEWEDFHHDAIVYTLKYNMYNNNNNREPQTWYYYSARGALAVRCVRNKAEKRKAGPFCEVREEDVTYTTDYEGKIDATRKFSALGKYRIDLVGAVVYGRSEWAGVAGVSRQVINKKLKRELDKL